MFRVGHIMNDIAVYEPEEGFFDAIEKIGRIPIMIGTLVGIVAVITVASILLLKDIAKKHKKENINNSGDKTEVNTSINKEASNINNVSEYNGSNNYNDVQSVGNNNTYRVDTNAYNNQE